ncbi:MAG: 2-hydroxy-acid oxidase, partial [Mesorhizobium sp.]
MTTLTPATAAETLATVQWAAAEQSPLEILGHGSKRGIGRPQQTEHTLDLSKLSG